ncbi:hypothetical protein JCM15548_11248 [Geofilum rubicundum JCM 15548]|uniref:Uncharacterized protein n=1 Tax=Geofilum rubicundum JCM 15548 TaxID=1236989 RepID=A0A0E9LVF0_9BACT|nr:hypothetical protein JCM15548_11248 [Geofilum rubicundum JCM 15548]
MTIIQVHTRTGYCVFISFLLTYNLLMFLSSTESMRHRMKMLAVFFDNFIWDGE